MSEPNLRTGPLADLVVLDVSETLAGAYAAKCFADLGADVIKVEPPRGDPLRHEGPFVGGTPHPEKSIPFLAANGGKRSVTLDLETDDGRALLRGLCRRADAAVVSGRFSRVDSIGLDPEHFLDDAPQLVLTSISPFGLSGQRMHWRATPMVLFALAGWVHLNGRPEREPLTSYAPLAESIPGLAAAAATLMAIHARKRTGRGQLVELSQHEILMLMTQYITVGYSYTGAVRARTGMPYPFTIVPAAGGHLGVNVLTEVHWRSLCAFMGREDLLDDPRFADRELRGINGDDLHAILEAWARDLPVEQTFLDAESWRLPFGMVPPVRDLPRLPQHQHRGSFSTVEHDDAGPLTVPGSAFPLPGRPAPRPAPRLGADNDAVLATPETPRD